MTDTTPDDPTADGIDSRPVGAHDDPLEAERETIAGLYEFAADVFADPPSPEAVEQLIALGAADDDLAPTDRLRRGFAGLERWRREVDDPEAAAAVLERSHTQLFVGPRPKLQAHESYYAGDFLGEPLARVHGSYAELGLEPASDLREEADHAAVELRVLALLTRREADEPTAKSWFLGEHGWWWDEFAADVDDVAGEDDAFYRAVAELAAGLVAFDAERLGVDPELPVEVDR
ncbi:TorD/DmsD family molecular chaperone [Natrarchaeobaculum sulfurireducens]|uniref:Cytoplasmic chaperone TorD n=1 Tax=Natrarchaeobaculum sulfurireducens TaxID=2044521 RepID=A0A346PE50_9EURY|nr:molecular chaperone TorD family protein [Natrarchaeobaculum sulfurireducens]AXR77795.1 putative component of anaerobic dehydrogenase [Natrarchaeobaculum sulfurireducens]AXR82222.1 Cytoplasmic chaperone TorD [Natrarchaeobaculum sulfurireducens]